MNATSKDSVPIVVDIDGTLIHSDLLVEGFFSLLSNSPLQALKALCRLKNSKASFKAGVADHAAISLGTLPFDEQVVNFLQTEKAKGRKIYLASASDHRHVVDLAAHCDFIDEGWGTSDNINLHGEAKADFLRARFGEKGYDYVGNDWPDLAVWQSARIAIAANVSPRLWHRLQEQRPDAIEISTRHVKWRTYARALRIHQWIKNILVFLPLLAGHFFTPQAFGLAFLSAMAFSFTASGAYLINDLLDLRYDREHATKRFRPLASGAMPLAHGMAFIPFLLGVAVLLSLAISFTFFGILVAYFAITFLYSVYLKRKVLVDVLTLACLYTIRVFAGTVALGITASSWLLGFSVFLFLCLAVIKRYVELISLLNRVGGQPKGRGYLQSDLPILSGFASASGFCSVLVLALYFNSPEVRLLYRTPELLWLTCLPLLYWICRMLLLAHRGALHDDPVVFAVTDKTSWLVGLMISIILALAL